MSDKEPFLSTSSQALIQPTEEGEKQVLNADTTTSRYGSSEHSNPVTFADISNDTQTNNGNKGSGHVTYTYTDGTSANYGKNTNNQNSTTSIKSNGTNADGLIHSSKTGGDGPGGNPNGINTHSDTNGTPGKGGSSPGDGKSDPEKPPKKFKSNRYATKKTAGQGLMGVSLITSNTTQLKGVLDEGSEADYYVLIVTLLITSLLLQAVVGVLLMIIGSRESKLDCDANKGTKKTEKLNDISTFFIFMITMVNATLAAFTVDSPDMLAALPSLGGLGAVNSTHSTTATVAY